MIFCFSAVLQKAGRHMEHTLIAAYVVLLLGYLIMDNKVYSDYDINRFCIIHKISNFS